MPKLLIFAPCEKVIISQDENNPTLIAVLSEIGGEYELIDPAGKKPNALPLRWTIFSMWKREPADEGKEFEQRVRLVSPGGKQLSDSLGSFTLSAAVHRMTIHVSSVPLGDTGDWSLELFLREKGGEWPSAPLATYPLQIHVVDRTKDVAAQ